MQKTELSKLPSVMINDQLVAWQVWLGGWASNYEPGGHASNSG